MNDKFSWNRFFRFARAEQAGERHEMLLKLGGFAVFCFVIYMICNMSVIFGQQGGYKIGMGYVFPRFMVMIAVWFLTFYNISGSFKRYFSQGQASQMLMLPAAKSEKFLYVALRNLIVIPFMLMGFILLNDIMWAHILGIESWIDINVADFMVQTINGVRVPHEPEQLSKAINFGIIWILGVFQMAAMFLLGAVFFRRRQFLLTLLSLFLWSILWLILPQTKLQDMIKWSLESEGAYVTMGYTFGLTILFMYIAWRRYSTLQITK